MHWTRLVMFSFAVAACRAPREAPEVAAADVRIEMPRPGPLARPKDAATESAACAACHAGAAVEHARSLHRRAFTDATFQTAYRAEPLAFCRDCHAPERDAALGVSCVTCHVTKGVPAGAVLAGAARDGRGASAHARPPPHAIVREPRFATAAACAGCHEFGFPKDAARVDDAKMQRTVTEHARSPFAETSCAGCHMPEAAPGGERSHAFAASRDARILSSAARVSAVRAVDPKRDADATLTLTLAPSGVGHAFPTGDLFRRLRVSAVARDAVGTETARAERSLGRHLRFMPHPSGGPPLQTELWDDRVMPDAARVVTLTLRGAARAHTIAWRVEYQRARSANGEDVVIEASVLLAEGAAAAP